MQYSLHYQRLIYRAQNRLLESDTYTELHHIVPRSIGGSDESSNLVALLPEEHLIAHLLLCKMHPQCSKLLYAANMMVGLKRGIVKNNKEYGWVRRRFSDDQRGKQQTVSEETKAKLSETWKQKYADGCKHNATGTKWTEERRMKSKAYWASLPKVEKTTLTHSEIVARRTEGVRRYYASNQHHATETVWITDGTINKRVVPGEALPEGFRIGRTFPKQRKSSTPPMTIYDSNGTPVISIKSNYQKSIVALGFPKSLYQTALDNNTLFETLRPSDLKRLINTGNDKFIGWHARYLILL